MHDAADLIRAIADLVWPVFAIVAVYVFRHRLAKLLSPAGPLRRAKASATGFEFEWEGSFAQTATAVEVAGLTPATTPPDLVEDLGVDAERSPDVAIMEAYARVESELRGM